MEFLIFLLTGVIAGFLSGLFGLGGGILVVPALAYAFSLEDLPQNYVMHLAVGTSLSVMLVTSASSLYSHLRRGSVMINLFWRFLPGILIGVIVGVMIASRLPTSVLKWIFAVFLLLIVFQMIYDSFFRKSLGKVLQTRIPSQTNVFSFSGIVGLLSGMLGVGAGSMTVPYFLYYRISMTVAAGTASAFGFVIALLGMIASMITGWQHIQLPWTTGFVYWPAFLVIGVVSVFFAPLGARASHRLPQTVLKRAFTVLLFLLAVAMLLGK